MKYNSEIFICFREFKVLAENQSGKKIIILRTDNGGEFESGQFQFYCVNEGIVRYYIISYSFFYNGIVERKNRILQETVRVMFKQSGLFF